jgi:adenylate cyclase
MDRLVQIVTIVDQAKSQLLANLFGDTIDDWLVKPVARVDLSLVLGKASFVRQTQEESIELIAAHRKSKKQFKEFQEIQKTLYGFVTNFNALQDLVESMISTERASDVLTSSIDFCRRLFACTKAVIFLYDEKSKTLKPVSQKGVNPKALPKLVFRTGEGIAGCVAAKKEPLIVDDVFKDYRFKKLGSIKEDRMSLMAVPLTIEGRLLGVMCIESPYYKRFYNRYDLQFFETIATQLTIAVENARIVENARRLQIELGRKVRELNTLFDISEATSLVLDVEETFQILVDKAAEVLNVEKCSLMELDEKEKILKISAQRGLPAEIVKKAQVPLGESISGFVAKSGKPIMIDNIESNPLWTRRNRENYFSHSCLCVPLKSGDKVLGVMNAADKKSGGAFRSDELRLMNAIAATGSQALSNAALVRDIIVKEREKASIQERFQQYVAPDVVAEVMDSDEMMRAGLANITILFCDVSNFTSVSEVVDPEVLVQMLNDYFTRMTEIVFEHRGTIDKFIGDAVQAIYGAPIRFDKHAREAVASAVEMVRAFEDIKNHWEKKDPKFSRIGLKSTVATGEAVVGNIGSELRLAYTAIGEPVRIAEEMEDVASMGQVLVDEICWKSVAGEFSGNLKEGMDIRTTSGNRNVYELIL